MIRLSLEADSPYVDAVVHGDGLTSLQYRKVQDGPAEEMQSPFTVPAAIQLERHGDVFTLSVSPAGGKPEVPARLFGEQGTINVPSWSPDSRSAAFVSYRFVAP